MPIRLDSHDADFEQQFVALLAGKREASQEVGDVVAGIIADVRARGDAALVELTNKFDGTHLTAADAALLRSRDRGGRRARHPRGARRAAIRP